MRKMPCLFVRDFSTRPFTITREITVGCEWVLEGLGRASIKHDGTACLVRGGLLYKRYDVKRGKTVPTGAIPCEPSQDPVTGHWPHWILVSDEPDSVWHREALANHPQLPDGTYELCGPRLQGNPEGLHAHAFIPHGSESVSGLPLSFEGLRDFLSSFPHEGIVWREPSTDRYCKLRRDDFGHPWPITNPRKKN